ncbi:hypothetical protein Ahia01_001062300 [Argonauta hians]
MNFDINPYALNDTTEILINLGPMKDMADQSLASNNYLLSSAFAQKVPPKLLHVCPFCDKVFLNNGALVKHMCTKHMVREKDKRFAATLASGHASAPSNGGSCGGGTVTPNWTAASNGNTRKSSGSGNNNNNSNNENDTSPQFTCVFCWESFRTRRSLMQHENIVHYFCDGAILEKHACGYCGMAFTRRYDLFHHIKACGVLSDEDNARLATEIIRRSKNKSLDKTFLQSNRMRYFCLNCRVKNNFRIMSLDHTNKILRVNCETCASPLHLTYYIPSSMPDNQQNSETVRPELMVHKPQTPINHLEKLTDKLGKLPDNSEKLTDQPGNLSNKPGNLMDRSGKFSDRPGKFPEGPEKLTVQPVMWSKTAPQQPSSPTDNLQIVVKKIRSLAPVVASPAITAPRDRLSSSSSAATNTTVATTTTTAAITTATTTTAAAITTATTTTAVTTTAAVAPAAKPARQESSPERTMPELSPMTVLDSDSDECSIFSDDDDNDIQILSEEEEQEAGVVAVAEGQTMASGEEDGDGGEDDDDDDKGKEDDDEDDEKEKEEKEKERAKANVKELEKETVRKIFPQLILRDLSRDSRLKCGVCYKKVPNLEALNGHLNAAHAGVKRHKCSCPYCPKSFMTSKLYLRHMQGHVRSKKKAASSCHYQQLLSSQSSSSAAAATGGVVGGGGASAAGVVAGALSSYSCPRCPKQFCHNLNLLRHHKDHHPVHPVQVCQVCCCQFVSKPLLRKHMKKHSVRNFSKCDFCTQSFTKMSTFLLHLLQHAKSGF